MPLALPSPITWAVAYKPKSADFNAQVRDPLNFLLNPPYFVAYQHTAQTLTNNAFTAVTWDTVTTDTYTGWSSGANTKYTAQVAGWYHVTSHVSFANNGTGRRAGGVFLNGSLVKQSQQEVTPSATAAALPSVPIEHKILLAIGDYIEIQAFQSSGAGLLTPVDQSVFQVKWEHV